MNFWQSSVAKVAAATLAAAVFAGCDSGTGLKELAESQAAYARRDLRAAEKAVSKSLRCNPKNVDALLHATRVQLELGHIAEARKLVTRAAELEPEASDVLLTDAEAAYIAKDYATAMRDYRSVAEDGMQPPEIRAQALAGIGQRVRYGTGGAPQIVAARPQESGGMVPPGAFVPRWLWLSRGGAGGV